jgi:hypothetical protein
MKLRVRDGFSFSLLEVNSLTAGMDAGEDVGKDQKETQNHLVLSSEKPNSRSQT